VRGHLLVDTEGLVMKAKVHSTKVSDQNGLRLLLECARMETSSIKHLSLVPPLLALSAHAVLLRTLGRLLTYMSCGPRAKTWTLSDLSGERTVECRYLTLPWLRR
jgi:hypothetical protein